MAIRVRFHVQRSVNTTYCGMPVRPGMEFAVPVSGAVADETVCTNCLSAYNRWAR